MKNTRRAKKVMGRGSVVLPDPHGRCGSCGGSNFTYNNGHEFSVDGVRGYRCAGCGNIKPEDWRKRVKPTVA